MGQFSERPEYVMLGKGKVSCQNVVTSPQVSKAKRNHDRDEMMKGSGREEKKEGGDRTGRPDVS